jgi:hypothetical protein
VSSGHSDREARAFEATATEDGVAADKNDYLIKEYWFIMCLSTDPPAPQKLMKVNV